MTAMDSVKAKLDEYEYLLKLQMEKIEELATENARLVAACDAHGVLKSIYLDPNASQTNRFKAAAASLPVEKPKLLSVVSSTEPSRAERWRAYARYQRKTEIIMETGRLPAPGSNWDLELTAQSYQPPEGDSEPPLDLYGRDAIKASYTISTLSRVGRKGNGNGNGGDESSGASE
jgi:hypothetical protein